MPRHSKNLASNRDIKFAVQGVADLLRSKDEIRLAWAKCEDIREGEKEEKSLVSAAPAKQCYAAGFRNGGHNFMKIIEKLRKGEVASQVRGDLAGGEHARRG